MTILKITKVVQKRKNVCKSSSKPIFTSIDIRLETPRKPKDDETIIKNVLNKIVIKVARRLAPRRIRRQSQTNNKNSATNNENQQQQDDNQGNNDVDQFQNRNPRRGGGRRGNGRPGRGYFIEQGKITHRQ